MRGKTKWLVASLMMIGVVGVAQAQPAPAPGMGDQPPPWMDHGHGGPDHAYRHDHWRRDRLVVPADDRKLTGPDVQKVAEAFLLWNGNRSWKVTGVTENSDNTVSFAYSSPKGDVIARFKMDRKTGHISRIS